MTKQEIIKKFESKPQGISPICKHFYKWDNIDDDRKMELIEAFASDKREKIAAEIKSRLGYISSDANNGHLLDADANLHATQMILGANVIVYKNGSPSYSDYISAFGIYKTYHPNDKAQLYSAALAILNSDYIYNLV